MISQVKKARTHPPTTIPNIVIVSFLLLVQLPPSPPPPVASTRLSSDPVGAPLAGVVANVRSSAMTNMAAPSRETLPCKHIENAGR